MHFTVNSMYFSIGVLILSPLITFFVPRREFPIYDGTYFPILITSACFFFFAINLFPVSIKELSGGSVGVLMYISIPLTVF